MRIAEQYVQALSKDELTYTKRSLETDGYREIWWTSQPNGDGLLITWHGKRLPCTCELYGECARCEPQRAAGRYVG